MVDSEKDIANLALGQIGEDPISGFDAGSVGAKAELYYGAARDAVLADYDWAFARRRQVLSVLEEDAGTYKYQLPVDPYCLMPRGFERHDAGYEVEGRTIITNTSSPTLIYTARVTDVTQFEQGFIEVLTFYLAARLAIAIKKSKRLESDNDQRYMLRLPAAKRQSAETRHMQRVQKVTDRGSGISDPRFR